MNPLVAIRQPIVEYNSLVSMFMSASRCLHCDDTIIRYFINLQWNHYTQDDYTCASVIILLYICSKSLLTKPVNIS